MTDIWAEFTEVSPRRSAPAADPWAEFTPAPPRERVNEVTVRPAGRTLPMPAYDAGGNPTGYQEDVDVPVAANSPSAAVRQSDDILKGIGGGLVRGVSGLLGAPAAAADFLNVIGDRSAQFLTSESRDDFQRRMDDRRANVMFPGVSDAISPQGIQRGIESVTGPAYVPETRAGKFASAAAEFAPGGMIGRPANIVGNTLRYGVAPGLASEAGGQAFEGSAMETPARIGGALVAGIGAAATQRMGSSERLLQNAGRGATQAELDAAEQLFREAVDAGTPISRAEALQAVTGGRTGMGDLQHTVEGMGGMRDFYASRPANNQRAAMEAFDNIAPRAADPDQIGPAIGGAAQQAMRETPEAQILADTLFRAGPRVTPEQAGATMQQELRAVYDRREGMRNALADQDYSAARNAPATIPQNGGYRVADVTTHYLDRPDIPIIIDPAERAAARSAWFEANNPTTRAPIIGERPTRFAQVDANPVVNHLDNAIGDAKGAVRQGLQAARNALMRPDGLIDTTVSGLHNSRMAIDDLIDQAQRAGARQTVSQLQTAKLVLDQALESVPAYGLARQNFRAASQPLQVFDDARIPGQIIERDQFNNRFVMQPERAPAAVQRGGPNAARDFNSVATPAAREAFEQNLVTQVLDKAARDGADLSADSIRQALRQNEDVLRQYPGVRDRLESVAIARDGLARIENSQIGRLAQRDQTTKKAVEALFPSNPLPGSQDEIATTMAALAQRQPTAARALVRTHAEMTFNEAAQRLATSGPSQSGGAKFAAVLRGNEQQAANLEAAVRALPDGNAIWPGFNRFLEIMEAQQFRQATGSRTAFKIPGVEDLKSGGLANNAAQVIAGGGFKWPQKVQNAIQQWNVGRNLDELAGLLTRPEAAADFRRLIQAPSGSSKAAALASRLTYLGLSAPKDGWAVTVRPADARR